MPDTERLVNLIRFRDAMEIVLSMNWEEEMLDKLNIRQDQIQKAIKKLVEEAKPY